MNDKPKTIDENIVEEDKKPDDQGGFIFSSMLKITDPVSNEVLVHVRGDN